MNSMHNCNTIIFLEGYYHAFGHQLKYFQTLANVENFTKASIELVLSQPALSRSISRLEEEIGVP